jgi:hypothetical protein
MTNTTTSPMNFLFQIMKGKKTPKINYLFPEYVDKFDQGCTLAQDN